MIGLYRTFATPAVIQASRRRIIHTTRSLKDSADAATKAASKPAAAAEASAMSKITSFPKDHPFACQLIIATTKTSAADLIVQLVVEKKSLSEVDWKRNGLFIVFGFTYLGAFQWWLMVSKYRQWFPTMDRFAKLSFAAKLKDTAGMIDAGKMVLFDIFVHMPLVRLCWVMLGLWIMCLVSIMFHISFTHLFLIFETRFTSQLSMPSRRGWLEF
jgi:hypothetical protein